jgi:hypothetical protein
VARELKAVIVCGMDEDSTEQLRKRQLAQEQAEREGLERAESDAEAARHQRRAEKAGYLREKLEEQDRAAEETGAHDRPLLGG